MATESDDDWRADPFWERRKTMVERDIAARGVRDPRVLGAMGSVRRERFVRADMVEFAYEDTPLPIGLGQTISQALIVAIMAEAAEIASTDRVLEVGTGSGYGAAVLGQLAGEVWSIERLQNLADTARIRLAEEDIRNVEVLCGDGTLGWRPQAPFDAIVVTAASPDVPAALRWQLTDGGRLVIPIGPESGGQKLLRIRRVGDEFRVEDLGAVRFVPLIGAQGWKQEPGEARS